MNFSIFTGFTAVSDVVGETVSLIHYFGGYYIIISTISLTRGFSDFHLQCYYQNSIEHVSAAAAAVDTDLQGL